MNAVQVIGRLTRDPEGRQTSGGTDVADMRIAIPRRNDSDKPIYVDVDAYGAQAKACVEYLAKGSRVGISGRIDFEEWTGKDEGRRSRNLIVAESVDFLDPRPASEDGESKD